MHTYQSTNPRAVANPLRSLPLYTPAHRVMGWTEMQATRSLLVQAEAAVAIYRANLISAHAVLGDANRVRNVERRRRHQGVAMRCINQARAILLTWNRKLDDCRAKLERLENQPELPFAAPVPAPEMPGRRVLREQAGTFPAGSVCTVEPGARSGFGARIVRPNGSGTATHLPTEAAALAWVDAQLAPPVLH